MQTAHRSSTTAILQTGSLMPGPLFVSLKSVLTFTLRTSRNSALVRVSKSRNTQAGECYLDSALESIRNTPIIRGFVANVKSRLQPMREDFSLAKIHPSPERDGLLSHVDKINDLHSLVDAPELRRAFSTAGANDFEGTLLIANSIEDGGIKLTARLAACEGLFVKTGRMVKPSSPRTVQKK